MYSQLVKGTSGFLVRRTVLARHLLNGAVLQNPINDCSLDVATIAIYRQVITTVATPSEQSLIATAKITAAATQEVVAETQVVAADTIMNPAVTQLNLQQHSSETAAKSKLHVKHRHCMVLLAFQQVLLVL